jgi:hypothetical protein
MADHGVPHYMKVDIEGYDYLCVRALDPKNLPKYISVELDREHDLVAELHQLGYQQFKILNQLTFTGSMPIAQDEIGLRLLRKASSKFPPLGRLLRGEALSSRLRRVDFDSFLDGFEYDFPEGSSGPFAEETSGPWYSAADLSLRVDAIKRKLTSGQIAVGSVWLDIHAKL